MKVARLGDEAEILRIMEDFVSGKLGFDEDDNIVSV